MNENQGTFLVKFKERAKEFGILAKQEFCEMVGKSVELFSASIGNELVLATFVPMIPSLVVDHIKQEIFKEHMPDLATRLLTEQRNLDEKYIQSREGQKLFKDTIKQILDETNDEKIEFLKKFLVNSYVLPDTASEIKYQFLVTLSALTPIELSILRIMFNPTSHVEKIVDEIKPYDGHIRFSIKDDLCEYLQLNEILFEKSVSNLKKNDCISDEGKDQKWSQGVYKDSLKNELIVRASADIKQIVTSFGNNFVKFVTREL